MMKSTKFPRGPLLAACAVTAGLAVLMPSASVFAGEPSQPKLIHLERLDRGLVAATTPDGVFLS